MSKAKASVDQAVPFHSMAFDTDFCAKLVPHTPSQVAAVLKVFMRPRRPERTVQSAMLILGEKGVGKSAVVKSYAQRNEIEMRSMLACGEAADLLPMADPLAGQTDKTAKNDRYIRYRYVRSFPLERATSPVGCLFADDVTQLDHAQQRIYRHIVCDGQSTGINGEVMPDNWIHVATGNIEKASYFLTREMEESLRNRIFPVILMVSNPKETLYFLSANQLLPDVMYKFLRMDMEASGEHILALTSRGLEYAGQFMKNFMDDPNMTMEQFLNAMTVPIEFRAAFKRYIDMGEDPDAYPMMTREIINADDAKISKLVSRMRKWAKNGENSLVTVTGYNMAEVLGDVSVKFTSEQMYKLCLVLNELSICNAALAKIIVLAISETDVNDPTSKLSLLIEHGKDMKLAVILSGMKDRQVARRMKTGL